MATLYKSGTFAVPGATGNYSVTGVGFQPDGVYFFGSNQSALDTVLTGTDFCVFGGMMAADWDSASILSRSVFLCADPKYSGIDAPPINCATRPAGTVIGDFRAQAVSLDSDGFTVNFDILPASGARYVNYLAWGESDNAGAHTLASGGGDVTLSLGWRAKALLSLGMFNTGSGVSLVDGSHWGWWGSNAYVGTSAADWTGAYVVCVSLSQQRIGGSFSTVNPPFTTENYHPGIIGTILGGDFKCRPTGGSLTDLFLEYVSIADSYDMVSFWDGEASNGQVTPSDTLNGTVVEPMENPSIDQVGAALFFTTGDTDGFGTTLDGNLGWGVATEEHEACVFVDSGAGAFYQSSTKSWCDNVDTGGAHAGLTTLGDGEMTLQTTVDGGPPAEPLYYIAFGPSQAAFVPQFYRLRKTAEVYPSA